MAYALFFFVFFFTYLCTKVKVLKGTSHDLRKITGRMQFLSSLRILRSTSSFIKQFAK